jgi:hypothetical protein
MRIAIIGAVIKPMVILVRPMKGSGTWKESGCMTKIVERKNNIRVAMAKPLISDMREKLQGFWETKCRTMVFIHLRRAVIAEAPLWIEELGRSNVDTGLCR